jgi:hypothetical protein
MSTLIDLATEITREHEAATSAAQTAIEHARRCGELLIQAKAIIGHGGFLRWVAENCHVGERQARNYMRIAQNWEVIANRQRASDLTLRQALTLTHDEKPEPAIDFDAMLAEVKAELDELVALTTYTPEFDAWLDSEITAENLRALGYPALRNRIETTIVRRAARILEINDWLDAVVELCRQRVRELAAEEETLAHLDDIDRREAVA